MQNSTLCRLFVAGALAVPLAGAAQGPKPTIREIATLPGVQIEAAVMMPNGRVVLYTTGDSILAYDLKARLSTFLTRGWGHQLRVAPAGDRLAYAGHDEDRNDFIMSIPLHPETGQATGPAQRVSISYGDEPSFSPDGKQLAFGIGGPAETQELAVVSVTGGPERILARYGKARIGETYWSADGRSVIAQVSRDSARAYWTLERVPVAGGSSEKALAYRGYSTGSIEGRIVFLRPGDYNRATRQGQMGYATASGRTGEFTVPRQSYPGENLSGARTLAVLTTRPEWAHIINLADGKLRELRPGSLHSRGPTWSPDGRQVALHDSVGGVYGITVMNADGSGARHYPVSTFPGFMRWAPNGRTLAYEPEPADGGDPRVAVLDLTTGTTRIVSSAPNASLLHYRWRADSKSLMVYKWLTRPDGGPVDRQLFDAPLTGSERMIRDLSKEFPHLTRGGPLSAQLVALGHAQNTEHYFLFPEGGQMVKLPRLELVGFANEPGVSRDGKWVAFLARNRNGPGSNIQLVSIAGDSLRMLRLPFEVDPSSFRPPFTPDGRSLILFGKLPGESVSKIFSVPLDGSTPKVLATLPTTSRVAGRLELSPDGTAVVFTSVGPRSSRLYEVDVTPILKAMGMQ